MKPGKPGKIGLALGGGAARGWAHLGVLRALEERGVRVDCVAGTSIGALVGASFALGKIDILEEFVAEIDWKRILSFLDVTFPRSGLIEGNELLTFFQSYVQEREIESLPLPYCAVAASLNTGREVVLDRGSLTEAVRASISVPGIFTPLRRGEEFLVDGGLVNPVPVSAVRGLGADYVIAVDLNRERSWEERKAPSPSHALKQKPLSGERHSQKEEGPFREFLERFRRLEISDPAREKRWFQKDPSPNIFEVMAGAINIMEAQITAQRMATDPPDLLIQPKVGGIGFFEFHRSQEAIAAGYEEAVKALQGLKDPLLPPERP